MAVTHRTALRLHVVLPSGDERLLQADYANDATVGRLSETLRQHCNLPDGQYDVCVMGANAALHPSVGLADAQLLHGQTVYMLPRRSESALPAAPYLHLSDKFRLVHESGSQLGLGWPLRNGEPLRLRLSDEQVLVPSSDETDEEALQAVLTGDRRAAVVTIESSDIELRINGWPASGKVEVRPGSLLQLCLLGAQGQMIDIRLMTRAEHETTRNRHGLVTYRVRPQVYRPTEVDALDLRLESEPPVASKPLDFVEVALQDGSMLLLYLVLVLRGGMGIWTILFLLVPLARIAYRFHRHQRDQDETVAAHRAWQARTEQELGVLRARAQQEAEALTTRHPSLELLAEAARVRGPLLWQRRPGDDGFLSHALGQGDFRASSNAIIPGSLTEGDKQDWRAYIERLKVVPDAAIEMSLLDHHFGLLAPRDVLYGAARHSLLRLLLSYSPAHLAVGALLPSETEDTKELSWLSWLPHVQSPTSLFIGMRLRFGPTESRYAIAESYEFLRDKPAGAEHLLLIVHEAAGVDVGILEPFVNASEGRVHILWIGTARSLLPAIVDKWLEFRSEDSATLYPGQQQLAVEQASRALADELGRSIAGLLDEGSSTVSAAVPQVVSLGSICSPALEAGSLVAAEALIAAVGETATSVMEIDLVEQGPHLLVGGTTGSGKSELLRSMLLSLVSRYASRELAMLLIDYKGGASLDQLRALPHCIGMVSNLGEDDVRRLIDFLNAELARRQGILKEFQGEYRLYRRAGHQELPRLVVVIDEFGGFTSPVGGGAGASSREGAILNIAARGRSLGVHLVLATQSPKGVVSSAVRANVNARLCLRALDDEDSIAVIGEADAARLPRSLPGRCFARLDTGELVQFQSAWTGSKTLIQRDDDEPVSLRGIDPAGLAGGGSSQSAADGGPADAETVITRILIREEVERQFAPRPYTQPSLAKRLEDYEDTDLVAPQRSYAPGERFRFQVGLRDDPGHQTQLTEDLDLNAGAMLVSGASASGRTTVLVNAARQLREMDAAAQIVVVDSAGGDLAAGADLGDDRTWIISTQLQASLSHLIEQLSVDYLGEPPAPVLVVVDRLDLCQDSLGANLPALARLIASGGRRNVLFVATADRRLQLEPDLAKAFRYRYQFRDDQSHIMSDVEGALVRAYLPPSASTAPTSAGLPLTRRPLGFLAVMEMNRMLAAARPRGVPVGVDEVRHEVVELAVLPGIAIVGPAGSGRTSCLLSLCWWAARKIQRPVPVLAGYEIPPCDWLIDIRKRWTEGAPATPDVLINILISTVPTDTPVLAIDDLDRLDVVIAGLGLNPDPTSSFRSGLTTFINNRQVAVFATGPLEILSGQSAIQNRITDALHAVHQNFVVLQPLPEDVAADRGVFGFYRRIAARPGRSYTPGSGIAMARTGRHEVCVRLPRPVEELVDAIPKDETPW